MQKIGCGWFEYLPAPTAANGSPPPSEYAVAMKKIADEMEERYQDAFDESASSLPISQETMYFTFLGVAEELFGQGRKASFGRLVAFYCFIGSLTIDCKRLNFPHLIRPLLEWTAAYVDQRLETFMANNNGWDGLVDFTNQPERPYSWTHTVTHFAIGAVGAISLGAILARIGG
jgi:hypothetical protein